MAFLTFDNDGHVESGFHALSLDTDAVHDILVYNHTQSRVRFFATVNNENAVIDPVPDIPGRDFRGHFQQHLVIGGEPAIEYSIPSNTAILLQVTTPSVATVFEVIDRDSSQPYRPYATRLTHETGVAEGQRLWFEIVNTN